MKTAIPLMLVIAALALGCAGVPGKTPASPRDAVAPHQPYCENLDLCGL